MIIWRALKAFGRILKPVLKLDFFIKRYRRIERTFENECSDYYLDIYSAYPIKNKMLRREWIEKQSSISFEGEEYTTFGDPKAVLAHVYGNDFMVPKQTHQHTERF